MPISMHCPNAECGKASRLPDAHRGRWVRCPSCGHKFQVPPEPASSKSTQEPVLAETLRTTVPAAKPAPSAQPGLPARIGRFVIQARLGAGAFGAVYRAHDPQLGREVALKVPHPGSLSEPRLVERFLREGRAAAGLHHPHIVPVFDAGQDGPHHYLAAAFIPGRSLAAEVATGPLAFRRAAELVRQLAEALAYAHEQGIVHRDIKPANVLLDEQGEAHLADFGLAHRADESGELTREGAVMGTPAYMAPEQAEGQRGKPLPASDQYSLGAVLYELLTGEAPFSGPPAIVLYNVVHQEPEPPRQRNPHIPPELEAVCLKAMARHPEQRYPSCAELAADLRRWLEGEPVLARPLGMAGRCLRWLKREPKLAGLAVLTVVCLLTAAGVATSMAQTLREKKTKTAESATKAAAEERRAADEKGKAEKQNKAAQRAAERGARAAREAKRQGAIADEAARRRSEQARKAREAEQDTKKQERKARQKLYDAHLALAEKALDRKDSERAFRALARHRDDDLRESRWQTLWKRLPDELTWSDHKAQLTCLALRPDGRALASGSGDQTVRLREWVSSVGQQPLTLRGHNHRVTSVCFSPDGKRIAAAGVDLEPKTRAAVGVVRVWDAAGGKEILSLGLNNHSINCVCFSPDGRRLATTSTDQRVTVWDAATGLKQLSIHAHADQITRVCFSPDGKRLATACKDGTVRVWHAATGRRLFHRKANLNGTYGVCFSPDGKWLATVGDDTRPVPGGPASWRWSDGDRYAAAGPAGIVKIWDAGSGQFLHTLKGGYSTLGSVCFSADGKRVAASDLWTGGIWIWDAATGAKQLLLDTSTRNLGISLSPDGNYLASGGADKKVTVWNVRTGRAIVTLRGHTDEVTSVCFSPDGKRLVSASKDRTVQVWDRVWQQGQALFPDHTAPITAVAFSRSGQLASAAEDNSIRRWDATTGASDVFAQQPGPITALAFSLDGKRLAGSGSEGTITLLSKSDNGTKQSTLEDRPGVCRALCFSPDGTKLAVGRGTSVRVWDIASGKERLALAGPTAVVTCLEFRPDGKTLAGGSADGSVRLWDAVTGKELALLDGKSGPDHALAFSPDGATLASGGKDRPVRLWSVPGGRLLCSLESKSRDVRALVYSTDGRLLTAAGSDCSPTSWTLGNGLAATERFSWPGSPGDPACAAVSPDGRLLAAGGKDKLIKLWDTSTGKQRGSLEVPSGGVLDLSFSPDGKTLASASATVVTLWDVPAGRRRGTIVTHARRLAFSPDGKHLATDNFPACTAELWELSTGMKTASFGGHPQGESTSNPAFSGVLVAGARKTPRDGSENLRKPAKTKCARPGGTPALMSLAWPSAPMARNWQAWVAGES